MSMLKIKIGGSPVAQRVKDLALSVPWLGSLLWWQQWVWSLAGELLHTMNAKGINVFLTRMQMLVLLNAKIPFSGAKTLLTFCMYVDLSFFKNLEGMYLWLVSCLMFFVLTRYKTVLKKMLLWSSSSELSERLSSRLLSSVCLR